MGQKKALAAVLLALAAMLSADPISLVEPPALREYPILTESRLGLLRQYAEMHFGSPSIDLPEPLMIVVHYTAMSGLEASLSTFKLERLPAGRTDIAGHGDVNVGIHYVIAKDGAVYRLQPENIMARHIIGFNWCSIGIEMVGRNAAELTDAQLASCARLSAWIASRHPTIQYLIGHHEYMKKDLPHFTLFREKDPAYAPTVKVDPGDAFMKRLRDTLLARYSLSLKE